MPSSQELRDIIRAGFAELGIDPTALAAMRETLLIQEGRFFGRSYVAGAIMAMWMLDAGLIQFYGHDGEMLLTVDVPVRSSEQRRAA